MRKCKRNENVSKKKESTENGPFVETARVYNDFGGFSLK